MKRVVIPTVAALPRRQLHLSRGLRPELDVCEGCQCGIQGRSGASQVVMTQLRVKNTRNTIVCGDLNSLVVNSLPVCCRQMCLRITVSAQRATATILLRAEVKLNTCAQLFEAAS